MSPAFLTIASFVQGGVVVPARLADEVSCFYAAGAIELQLAAAKWAAAVAALRGFVAAATLAGFSAVITQAGFARIAFAERVALDALERVKDGKQRRQVHLVQFLRAKDWGVHGEDRSPKRKEKEQQGRRINLCESSRPSCYFIPSGFLFGENSNRIQSTGRLALFRASGFAQIIGDWDSCLLRLGALPQTPILFE